MPDTDDVFTAVFVCTGNRARSALGEAFFNRETTGLQVRSSSVGTLDVGSRPALPAAVEAGRRLGVDLTRHRSRALIRADLSAADLVLGFETHHVSAAVAEGKADPARAFLLGELVVLLEEGIAEGGTTERARAAIVAAHARRLRYRPNQGALVVPDPLGKPQEVMYQTAEIIDALVRRLVCGLFGSARHDSKSTCQPCTGRREFR